MTLTIEVSPEIERRLEAKARQHGQSVPDFLREVVERAANGSDTNGSAQEKRRGVTGYGCFAGRGPTIEQRRRWKEQEIELEEAQFQRRSGQRMKGDDSSC